MTRPELIDKLHVLAKEAHEAGQFHAAGILYTICGR